MEQNNANDLYEQGQKFYRRSQYDKAVKLFQECIQLDPHFLPALKKLGSFYNGDHDDNSNSGTWDIYYFYNASKAASCYQKCIQIDPKYSQGYLRLSKLNSNSQKAVQYLLRGLQQEPNNQQILYSLGLAYYEINNKQEAAKFFKQCIEMNRKNPKPYHELGLIYEEWEKYEEAAKFVKKRIQLYNGKCDDYAHLARIYDKMGKKEAAIAQYNKCLYLRKDHQQANKYLNKHGKH